MAAWAAVAVAVLALTVAAAPVTIVALAALAVASLRDWEPRRLFRAAAWCGPMVAVWLASAAVSAAGRHGAGAAWQGAVAAPYRAWAAFWQLTAAGAYPRAAASVLPLAIPLGLAAGGLAWAYRIRQLSSGAGGLSPAASAAFDRRRWRRQVRAARALIASPGSVPLTMRGDLIVVGAVIRTVDHQAGRVAVIGYQRMRSHSVVVGTTGIGKTTLELRLSTAFMTIGLRRHAAGLGNAPLLAAINCKGGRDARQDADRFRRVLNQAGARSVAIWPDEARLSLWSLPPRQLTTTLIDLVEHGTGSAAFYADVMDALVALAVEAPCGPPASASDLIARLEPG